MLAKRTPSRDFGVRLWIDVLIGVLAASFFYSCFAFESFRDPWLLRYVAGHPVSIATVYLFCISCSLIIRKAISASGETKRIEASNTSVVDLMHAMPSGSAMDTVRWLDSMLAAQSESISRSLFNSRLAKILRRLIQRGTTSGFDEELQVLSDEDAIVQHESYSVVRIICWAMPMLGFLGTVIGISQTLGSMDMKLLASGDQSAMDSLTAGLYIAFDTTAIGLVLTIAAMFMQFAVSGWEVRILRKVDTMVADRCFAFLKAAPERADDSTELIKTLSKSVVDGVTHAIDQLMARQAQHWASAVDKLNHKWDEVSSKSGEQVSQALQQAIAPALATLAKEVHKTELAAIDALDTRYQQWQTTFSEQSRQIASHHDELLRQTQLLNQLVENCNGFSALDETIQTTLRRMTDIDRFHEAAICMTEAIAVLGIQLERSGQIGKMVRETPRRREVNLFKEDPRSERDAA